MNEGTLERAPEFCLADQDGRQHCLAHYRGSLVLLVFVRHFDCPCCRAHLLHLQSRWAQLRSLGVDVLVVSMEPSDSTLEYARELGLSFTVLSDTTRDSYRLYGLTEQAPPGHTALRGLLERLSTAGSQRQNDAPAEAMRQLGGDFIVDGDGIVRFAYCSRFPSDRPAASLLLAVLRELARLSPPTAHHAARS